MGKKAGKSRQSETSLVVDYSNLPPPKKKKNLAETEAAPLGLFRILNECACAHHRHKLLSKLSLISLPHSFD